MSDYIKNRYDFIYLFDVKDGNPNGDPDQGNSPRIDIEDNHGLVTDVCIKRKVRNYVQLKKELESPYNIFIRQDMILNNLIGAATGEKTSDRKEDMCKNYYDIRTFGAVMSTGKKQAGIVRGPAQFTFARSIDPIYFTEHSITRCAVTTKDEAKKQESRESASTFGKKSTVPYGLYKMHGFISASDAKNSNFSNDDLELLWEALLNAFEHDRAAARGLMNVRKLIVFKHNGDNDSSNILGYARSIELFDRVDIKRKADVDTARDFSDYTITIDKDNLPNGIEVIEKL